MTFSGAGDGKVDEWKNGLQCLHFRKEFPQTLVPLAEALQLANESPSCVVYVLFNFLLLWRVNLCVIPLKVESYFL